jgi:hypothetical protein
MNDEGERKRERERETEQIGKSEILIHLFPVSSPGPEISLSPDVEETSQQ